MSNQQKLYEHLKIKKSQLNGNGAGFEEGGAYVQHLYWVAVTSLFGKWLGNKIINFLIEKALKQS